MISHDSHKWIYECNQDDSHRYVLGIKGKKTVLCFGINPSTAKPEQLDNTLKSVERLARNNGFDSWIMANIYPQRATHPNDIHRQMDLETHQENVKQIEQILSKNKVVIWAAWGTLIEKRPFLKGCLQDIYQMSLKYKKEWVITGKRSIKGHPHHPLYLKSETEMEAFDMESYMVSLSLK